MKRILGLNFVHISEILETNSFVQSLTYVQTFPFGRPDIFNRELQTRLYEICEEAYKTYETFCIEKVQKEISNNPFVIFYIGRNDPLHAVVTNTFAKCNVYKLQELITDDLQHFYRTLETKINILESNFYISKEATEDIQFHIRRIEGFWSCIETFRKENPEFPISSIREFRKEHMVEVYFCGEHKNFSLLYTEEKEYVLKLEDEEERIEGKEELICATQRLFERSYKKMRLKNLYRKPDYYFSQSILSFLIPSMRRKILEGLQKYIDPNVLENKATVLSSKNEKILVKKLTKDIFVFEVFGVWIKFFEHSSKTFFGYTLEEVQQKEAAYIKQTMIEEDEESNLEDCDDLFRD